MTAPLTVFLVNLGGLPTKLTTICFVLWLLIGDIIFFFKFGLAVFLFGLLLRDITFNESGAVIAVHANAVTIDRSVVCEKFVALHPRRMTASSLLAD